MRRVLAVTLVLALSGCSRATRAGVAFLDERADLRAAQIVRDLCSITASPCDTLRHSLDLYQPAAKGWSVVVFVHGGNWDGGDKNYRAGSADVDANIGRFYAARGIGVAVINYRLQPAVAWPAQVADVRAAVAWVKANIQQHGGRPDRGFLMGHSAGAHLASMVALTTSTSGLTTSTSGLTTATRVQGVIAVSGAALDVAARSARSQAPPFLILPLRRRRNQGPTAAIAGVARRVEPEWRLDPAGAGAGRKPRADGSHADSSREASGQGDPRFRSRREVA